MKKIFLPRKYAKLQRQCTYTLFIPVLFELTRFIADRKKKKKKIEVHGAIFYTRVILRDFSFDKSEQWEGGDKTPQQNGFLVTRYHLES